VFTFSQNPPQARKIRRSRARLARRASFSGRFPVVFRSFSGRFPVVFRSFSGRFPVVFFARARTRFVRVLPPARPPPDRFVVAVALLSRATQQQNDYNHFFLH